MATDHIVEMMTLKVGAHLKINGFGILSTWSGRPAVMTANVSGYLVEGWNRIELDIERVPEPEGVDGDPILEMKLFGTPRGEKRAPAEMWLGVSWTPDTVALPDENAPADKRLARILDHRFSLNAAPGKWRFLQAPILTKGAAAIAAQQVVNELATALRGRKIAPVRQLLGMRFTELGLGADVSRDEIEDAYLLPIGEMLGTSDVTVEAALAGELDVVPAFDGRVYHVRRAASAGLGRAPIVLRTPVSELALPISIAEIDGRPTIVR